jgi:cyclopropane-fatty-acyl-phospholipid synthase
MASPRAFFTELLKKADIEVGGSRPQDIEVHDEHLWGRVLWKGNVGLGEAYMDGWWDANALDAFIVNVLKMRLDAAVAFNLSSLAAIAKASLMNLQSPKRAFVVGEEHYDLGNDLYEAMLDRRMVYTCGYWSSPTTPARDLDDAQEQKLDLVCRKIGLKQGDRVLDIGCGWGSFAKFVAEKYGAEVVGITISVEQAALARERCAGLPVEIRVEDYREVHEEFDHIVSLGMFEHVGPKNYRAYFEMANRCLKPGGIFLLHTIGQDISRKAGEPWFEKYIFPNSVLPSIKQIGEATEGLFVMEDWHNFGSDYDTTLMAWFENFDKAWPTLREKYGDRFYRMWKYYLLSCAGSFRSRHIHLWQVVLSKGGVKGGYRSVR